LGEAQAQRLEHAFRSATDTKLRDRLNVVRLAHKGRRRIDIADELGLSTRSVQRWLNAYLERGIEGLAPRKAPGAKPHIPQALAEELHRWVIEGPAQQGLDRANWTHPELADHLIRRHGIRTSRSAVQRLCAKLGIRSYRPTYSYLRGDPAKQAKARLDLAALKGGALRGELVLLSQDEARFPMVPTLAATLGVKGHRPRVGTRDNKGLLYALAVMNLTTAGIHATTLECPAIKKKSGQPSKNRRLQEAFARHLRHVGRVYPQGQHKRVVLVIDNAPWHRGAAVTRALADNPHLELHRLPAYSPKLNPIERFWKVLRRRATHNRLFDTLGDLKASVRNSLRYFQTVRSRVKQLIDGRPRRVGEIGQSHRAHVSGSRAAPPGNSSLGGCQDFAAASLRNTYHDQEEYRRRTKHTSKKDQ
jgi:transposase